MISYQRKTPPESPEPKFLRYLNAQEKLNFLDFIRGEIRNLILRKIRDVLAQRIQDTIVSENAQEYCEHLQAAWNAHNEQSFIIDRFLDEKRELFSTSDDWHQVRELLATDSSTRIQIYSGGIKEKSEREAEMIVQKYRLSQQEQDTLYTPGFESFPEKYFIEHIAWFCHQDNESPSTVEGQKIDMPYLVDTFHCGDEELMRIRIERMQLEKYSMERLKTQVRDYKEKQAANCARKTYLMLERPDIRSFEALLKMDNFTEYRYQYALLTTFPRALLKREVGRRLREFGMLNSDLEIFALTKEELLAMVDRVISTRSRRGGACVH